MSQIHQHILEILQQAPLVGAGSITLKLRDRRIFQTVPQVQTEIERMIVAGVIGFETLGKNGGGTHDVYFSLQRTPRQVRAELDRASEEVDLLTRALGRKERLREKLLEEMDSLENQAAWLDRVLASQGSEVAA